MILQKPMLMQGFGKWTQPKVMGSYHDFPKAYVMEVFTKWTQLEVVSGHHDFAQAYVEIGFC